MSAPAQHRPAATERWLARLALLAILVAALLPLAAAGWRGLLLPFVIGGHLVLIVIGAWLALAHRGALRVIGIVLAVGAVVVAAVLVIRANLLWVVIVSAALLVLAAMAGRAALRRGLLQPYRTEEVAVGPPSRPFLIMNPRSGGGKVVRFGLREKAEALGAEVALLEGPGTVDVGAAGPRRRWRDGADLLGVAGGDGTQALVAGVAAEHDIPLLVISAGTRNHFALDLGLDREDPSTCLDALRRRGRAAGRPRRSSTAGRSSTTPRSARTPRSCRARPTATTSARPPSTCCPTCSVGHRAAAGGQGRRASPCEGPQAVLVSNNPYGTGDIAGLGRRPRLDGGVLGVIGVRAANAVQAARMLRGRRAPGLTLIVTEEVVVDADVEAHPGRRGR